MNQTKCFVVASYKGGPGKTTTAGNLACAWGVQRILESPDRSEREGYRVLTIDIDPQFGLTRSFGVDPSQAPGTTYEVLKGDVEIADAVVRDVEHGVDLLPARRELRELELSLVTEYRREEFLARALEGQTDPYDIVIIDCSPNLGLLTVNALFAAPNVIVPVSMLDPGALQGVGETRAIVHELASRGVPTEISAVIRTSGNERAISYDVIEAALQELDLPLVETVVPERKDFNNAMIAQRPLVAWKPKADGAQAYVQIAKTISQQMNLQTPIPA